MLKSAIALLAFTLTSIAQPSVMLTGVDTLFDRPEILLKVNDCHIVVQEGATVANITFIKLLSLSRALTVINGETFVLTMAKAPERHSSPAPLTEPSKQRVTGCDVQRFFAAAGEPLPPGIDLEQVAKQIDANATLEDLQALYGL